MTTKFITFVLLLLAGTTGAYAGEFPKEATYLFYIHGKYAGERTIKATETAKNVVFESTGDLEWGDEYMHRFKCRTEVDKESLKTRRFVFDGVKMKDRFYGSLRVDGDSVFADYQLKDAKYSSKTHLEPNTVFSEGYVPEHAMVLAHILARSEDPYQRVSLFYPSDFFKNSALCLLESEAEVPSTPPRVCRKYSISVQSSTPYLMFVDSKTDEVVYMAFPSSMTEVFLVEAFGTSPTPLYQPDEALEQ